MDKRKHTHTQVDLQLQSIVKYFPTNFELSYEKIVHKKVYDFDLILAIPEGSPCFVWFTTFKDQNVCCLLELDSNKKISKVSIVITSFVDKLSYGTIFYGTFFRFKNYSCFSIEDIFYYKGKQINQSFSFLKKLEIIKNILKNEISSLALCKNYLIFGLPIISFDKNFNKFLNDIEVLPYKIRSIHFITNKQDKTIYSLKYFKPGSLHNNNNNNNNNNNKNRSFTKKAIFRITPDLQNDIYHLHSFDNGKFIYYDIAYIPDYKTSVLMNKLFRKIKENYNLDSLEESDSEEEFENDKPDKFVFLNKSYKMVCQYNNKFNKWTPISIVDKRDKIITLKELNNQ